MSAESKESQPSIDDILSSIREIIADDSSQTGATEESAPRNGETETDHQPAAEQPQHDILSVLRGGQAQEPGTNAGGPSASGSEDVLDLSEEFIVTEATAALRRERERLEEAETAAEVQQEDAAAEESPTEASSPAEPEEEAVAQAESWPQDFQMPVGDEGPTSPFTATRTYPESAWPAGDPFDATESYKLARSQWASTRFASTGEEEQQADTPATGPEQDTEAPEAADHADEPGIELTSLTEFQPEESAETEAEQRFDSETSEDQGSEQVPAGLAAFPAADELEAVFGMPPREWAGSAQPQAEKFAGEDEADIAPIQDAADQSFPAGAVDETFEETPDESQMTTAYAQAPDAPQPPEAGPEPQPQQTSADDLEPSRQAAHAPETVAQPPAFEPPLTPPASVGGKTLEDSVKELLRPMLQEWLDKNMPRLVEAAMREHVAAAQGQSADDGAPAPHGDSPDDER
jgi:cell pole-organizing protein PopZ